LLRPFNGSGNIHKGYPQKAKKYEDLVNIPDRLSVTADGQPFVLLNGTLIPEDPIPNVKRILIFYKPLWQGHVVWVLQLVC
jgi:hypothetical protein